MDRDCSISLMCAPCHSAELGTDISIGGGGLPFFTLNNTLEDLSFRTYEGPGEFIRTVVEPFKILLSGDEQLTETEHWRSWYVECLDAMKGQVCHPVSSMIALGYTLRKLNPLEVWGSLHGWLHVWLWRHYSGKYEVRQWYNTRYHLTLQGSPYQDPL